MPVVRGGAQVSYHSLLEAARNLSPAELEKLQAELQAIQVRRRAPSLSEEESRLLVIINQDLPDAMDARYCELVEAREKEILTPEEYRELLKITEQREEHWAERMAAAADLARLRGVRLPDLLAALGLPATRSSRRVI
jgi:muconolactone delta-isomerase